MYLSKSEATNPIEKLVLVPAYGTFASPRRDIQTKR